MSKYQDEFGNLPVADPTRSTERTETLLYFCPRCERVTTKEGLCNKCIAQGKEFEVENVEAE